MSLFYQFYYLVQRIKKPFFFPLPFFDCDASPKNIMEFSLFYFPRKKRRKKTPSPCTEKEKKKMGAVCFKSNDKKKSTHRSATQPLKLDSIAEIIIEDNGLAPATRRRVQALQQQQCRVDTAPGHTEADKNPLRIPSPSSLQQKRKQNGKNGQKNMAASSSLASPSTSMTKFNRDEFVDLSPSTPIGSSPSGGNIPLSASFVTEEDSEEKEGSAAALNRQPPQHRKKTPPYQQGTMAEEEGSFTLSPTPRSLNNHSHHPQTVKRNRFDSIVSNMSVGDSDEDDGNNSSGAAAQPNHQLKTNDSHSLESKEFPTHWQPIIMTITTIAPEPECHGEVGEQPCTTTTTILNLHSTDSIHFDEASSYPSQQPFCPIWPVRDQSQQQSQFLSLSQHRTAESLSVSSSSHEPPAPGSYSRTLTFSAEEATSGVLGPSVEEGGQPPSSAAAISTAAADITDETLTQPLCSTEVPPKFPSTFLGTTTADVHVSHIVMTGEHVVGGDDEENPHTMSTNRPTDEDDDDSISHHGDSDTCSVASSLS